jgi:Fe-S-cluster containining protein
MNKPAHSTPHKFIAFLEYDILVPFVCHCCGCCCRKYEPIVELALLPEIARILGETIDVVQNRLKADSLSHRAGRPTDCCFLHTAHSGCIIYAVRPTACRQFPPLDGVGAGNIDCPGYREFETVRIAFVNRAGCVSVGRPTIARRRRQVPAYARPDVLHTLSDANVSDGYRDVFKEMNECRET